MQPKQTAKQIDMYVLENSLGEEEDTEPAIIVEEVADNLMLNALIQDDYDADYDFYDSGNNEEEVNSNMEDKHENQPESMDIDENTEDNGNFTLACNKHSYFNIDIHE